MYGCLCRRRALLRGGCVIGGDEVDARGNWWFIRDWRKRVIGFTLLCQIGRCLRVSMRRCGVGLSGVMWFSQY